MKSAESLKLFFLSHSLVRADLDAVEKAHVVELGHRGSVESPSADPHYLQFASALRAEAASMAAHYEIFYCLENSIRELVSSQLNASKGATWWDNCVSQVVKDNVAKNLEREREAGVTLRSADPIDYTTFGELGEIIQSNWESFGDTFRSKRALSKVLTGLNLLRAPIAHCAPLAEDEIVRLQLSLRDWFRLME